ncbi:MAG: 3-methyl-2-oxobutanoate dehydrogenase subunit beta, partial [Spirochaetales bacterium]|nr:3-methyl-2-oxobutanoate dehydrogenase subunit beta [Spirochaetales bacterium]
YLMDDAEYCIVAFGIAARVAKNAITMMRKDGLKVGLIRPITVWPFPKKAIREASDKVKGFVSVELSMGQMIEDVRLAEECRRPVVQCNRAGGMIPGVDQIITVTKDLVSSVEGGAR